MKTELQNIPGATNSAINRIYDSEYTLLEKGETSPNDIYLGEHINSSIGCRVEGRIESKWPPQETADEYVVINPRGIYSSPVEESDTLVRPSDKRLGAVLHEVLGPDPEED